jgi:hypothetical protein
MFKDKHANTHEFTIVSLSNLDFDISKIKEEDEVVIVGDVYGGKFLPNEAGEFIKWSKTQDNAPHIRILNPSRIVHRRSHDIWMPLMFLAQQVCLPIVLSTIASFIYEKSKGLLMGEKVRVKFSLLYKQESGSVKRFDFEGDIDALDKLVKESKGVDLETFFDDSN